MYLETRYWCFVVLLSGSVRIGWNSYMEERGRGRERRHVRGIPANSQTGQGWYGARGVYRCGVMVAQGSREFECYDFACGPSIGDLRCV